MTFREYYNACDGSFIEFTKFENKILIINESNIIVKTVYISDSAIHLDLNSTTIYDKFNNKYGLDTELKVMNNGHHGKDWLFFSHHQFVL